MASTLSYDVAVAKTKSKSPLRKLNPYNSWTLYLMVIPGLLFFIFFKYIPMGGIVIAFQDYSIFRGIFEAEWVGFEHFATIFAYRNLSRIILNTFRIGLQLVIFTFPVPIILALLINEIASRFVKRSVQTLLYLPHFFSWVLIASLMFRFLGATGPYNTLRLALGLERSIPMLNPGFFDPALIIADVWKNAGWGTIVYLAAIAGISPSLYESAVIDGANRFQRMRYITLPSLLPTIVILLLLRLGRFLDIGFDFVFQFINPLNIERGDIIATYAYRAGIIDGKYSLTTALGLFSALIGFVMVTGFNYLAKKTTDSGGLF